MRLDWIINVFDEGVDQATASWGEERQLTAHYTLNFDWQVINAVERRVETQQTCTWTWAEWTSAKFQGLTKCRIILPGREIPSSRYMWCFGCWSWNSYFTAGWRDTMFVSVIFKSEWDRNQSVFCLVQPSHNLMRKPFLPIWSCFQTHPVVVLDLLAAVSSFFQSGSCVGFPIKTLRAKRFKLELCKMDQPKLWLDPCWSS